ncbi:MAG: TolC family protein [Cyclobacteriaceae bacterium]|nr:TolC family protein [Cyclobacteriaceae bacterium]
MKHFITKTIRAGVLMMGMVLCAPAHAQTYSLDECIRVALENNQNLKNSKLNIQAAAYNVKEVKSALLPTINVTGQTVYYQNIPSQYAPASAFGGSEGEYQKLTLGVAQTTSANIQMTQNLYNHAAITGLKAARVYQEASVLKADLTREDLVYSVMATYYSIQVLSENLGRIWENILNLEKTTELNKALMDNDLVSANTHSRMQINLENLRNQYENQKLMQEQNITLLKLLMNVDIQSGITVEPFEYSTTLATAEAGDIGQRTDIKLQHVNIRLAQFDKKVISAGYYPVLTNTFSYGYTSYYDSFAPFKQINNDWIKSSYMALTLRIPVFDGFQKKNQLHQKELAIQQNLNSLEAMKRNADKEVEDALQNYFINRNLLTNTKRSLDLAEKLFASSRSEYESGITSVTELLNAQNDLSNARTNYSTALLNVKLAELALKKANGKLLTQSESKI